MTFVEFLQLVGVGLFLMFILSGACLIWHATGEMIEGYLERKKGKDKGEE